MEENILFVTRDLSTPENTGGIFVSRMLLKMVENIYNKNIDIFIIEKPKITTKMINIFFRQYYGQTRTNFHEFRQLLKEKNYTTIIFNSSIYGVLVRFVKKHVSSKIVVYYHNVEYKYYWEKFLCNYSFFAYVYSKYIKYNEKLSSKNSEKHIVLNQRDARELYKIYQTKADLILPISLPVPSISEKASVMSSCDYCLFVGSDFFANFEGISWFIENVLPYIHISLYVVGSVCNSLSKKYKNIKKVKLCGYVDSLEEYYKNAKFVVSPIFKGSGMKTKTIEALSFGKCIVGTNEAFVGIDGEINKLGSLCNTAEEFIREINNNSYVLRNPYALKLFLEQYSIDSNSSKLENFLKLENNYGK